jgi:hypothetical protein
MKIEELKRALKPLIKECIKELLFEEKGVLAHIIKESMAASGDRTVIREVREAAPKRPMVAPEQNKEKLTEIRKKMLAAVGTGAYGGIDVFKDVAPAPAAPAASAAPGPLDSIDPSDEGVPIDKIFEGSNNWGKIALTKKKG